jgi:hypothetical protein
MVLDQCFWWFKEPEEIDEWDGGVDMMCVQDRKRCCPDDHTCCQAPEKEKEDSHTLSGE